MRQRILGRTGLEVSACAVGTVELGLDYGIRAPGAFGRPAEGAAVSLLRRAAESGVTLFDTAPAYGESERLLGRALGREPRCLFATKTSVPTGPEGEALRGPALRKAVLGSLERSLEALGRTVLDVVQIHNATTETIARGEMAEAVTEARRQGKVRFLGASVYTEAEALAAIASESFDLLQVGYSLLDQRMSARVFPAAAAAGVGVLVRSALLKGALTEKAAWLPDSLAGLRRAAERARDVLDADWAGLPALAVRFCLAEPSGAVAGILTGVRTEDELDQALAAFEAGPLLPTLLARTPALAIHDERWLNPALWPGL